MSRRSEKIRKYTFLESVRTVIAHPVSNNEFLRSIVYNFVPGTTGPKLQGKSGGWGFLCASSCWYMKNKTPCLLGLSWTWGCVHTKCFHLQYCIHNLFCFIQNAPFRLLIETKIPCIVFRFRENESCNENENASNLLSLIMWYENFYLSCLSWTLWVL